jgi:hypothetical protein
MQLAPIEAQQIVAARMRARAALCLEPDILWVDIDLSQAGWVEISVVG